MSYIHQYKDGAWCETCGYNVDILGTVHSDIGNFCGLCESEYVQDRSWSHQAAKIKLITSNRHTTNSLLLVTRDGLLLRKLMDMLVGPNELVWPKFAKRLKIENLRHTLLGRHPIRMHRHFTIFGPLKTAWVEDGETYMNCLDKIIDFITPVDEALGRWKWSSLRYSERTTRKWPKAVHID